MHGERLQHLGFVQTFPIQSCRCFPPFSHLKKRKKRLLLVSEWSSCGICFFLCSEFCDVSCGLCIHFSPKLPKKMQNQYDDDEYNHSLLELMKKMRDRILPALLECTIKGTSSEDEVWASHFQFQTAFMY